MVKVLLLWEVDQTKVPVSPQERGAGWAPLLDTVKEDIKEGRLTDWGGFVGELRGYAVAEGTEAEIGNLIQKYVPFIIFKAHAAVSVDQMDEVIKALTT